MNKANAMNLTQIRNERRKWLKWKNIAPLREALEDLFFIECDTFIEDTIKIKAKSPLSSKTKKQIENLAFSLRPWRKGPFEIFDIFIDSEWNSAIKYNLLSPYFDLEGKIIADIGCNNGYYMFRMLENRPKEIVGFDPSPLFKTQFDFINHFVKSDIKYELLGIEHLEYYEKKFDTVFCLGVLYHRSDPIGALKSLKKSLNKNGELYLDTFFIDGKEDIALTPKNRYSKIPNIFFIPTVNALKNWCFRAGFKDIEILARKKTLPNEQRKTDWIEGESLENFLDPHNKNLTVEGYPAPQRIYIRASI